MKKCPSCAEQILDEATKCRYCHTELTGASGVSHTTLSTSSADIIGGVLWGGGFLAFAVWGTFHFLIEEGKLPDDGSNFILAFSVIMGVAMLFLPFLHKFKCSHCGQENTVFGFAKSKKCSNCKLLHLIQWQ